MGGAKQEILGTLHRPRRRKAQKLGEYFRSEEMITEEELAKALRLKNNDNSMIGMAMVRLGLVSERDIAEALATMAGLETIGGDLEAEKSVVARIPEALAKQHNVLPLAMVQGKLQVAVDRPLARPAQRNIERAVRASLVQRIAPSSLLLNAIALTYTGDTIMDAEGVSAIEIVDDIVIKAVKLKVSDIHLEPLEERVRLRYRIDGVLKEMETYNHEQFAAVVSRIKVLSGLNIAEKRSPQDGAISFAEKGIEIDLRVSILPSLYGEKVVMRLLAGKAMQLTIDHIGLSDTDRATFADLVKRPYGIVMIVGPTGSGKSTTLSAALNTINEPEINIITVEDPVEYKIDGVTQVHVGQNDKLTFASALRSILRQDPDVIMVGETRDSETADISLRAALTGHMVFTTLHTNDAPGALPRLVDMGCEPFLVSSSVTGVLAQRLVRKLCTSCSEPYQPSENELRLLEIGGAAEALEWRRAVGCERCNGTGYRGRIGIFELLEVDGAVQRAVMDGAPSEKLMALAIENGMKTLREDAVEKLNAGITSFPEVIRVTIS